MEYAPTADTIGKDYAAIRTVDDARALAGDVRAAGTHRPARAARRSVRDARRHRRTRVRDWDRARRATSRSPALRTRGSSAPRKRPIDAGLSLAEALAIFGPLLEDESIRKVGHDLKFDAIVLARHGITLRGLDDRHDARQLPARRDAVRPPARGPRARTHRLQGAARGRLCGRGAKAMPFARSPLQSALDYAGERADLALQLGGILDPLLEKEQLADALPASSSCRSSRCSSIVERAGIRIDGRALSSQARHVEQELSTRSAQIFELAGEEFNINSPQQLSRILFDKLQLPTLKRNIKTRTASTAVEVLEELALAHDLPRLILEWRALQKLKGTYIDALPQLVNPETGRVHTCFNQAVAATGRLSSSDPNLQNIPIRTELGREIRRAFVAEPGHVLISADYSQIELRVLAHLSGDAALIDAFSRGEDIHDRTAAKVFGENSGLGAHELRRRAKIINYALLYGKTAFTLAKDIGVTPAGGAGVHRRLLRGLPRGARVHRRPARGRARQTGVVKTMFGRRRLVPELTSRNGQIRAGAERDAVNLPIQGTAADILKRAMIDVHAALRAHPQRRPHDPHGARRAAVRSAARSRRRNGRARQADDGGGRGAEGAADRGRRRRRELEGGEELAHARTGHRV